MGLGVVMSSTVIDLPRARVLPGRKYDHVFFSSLAILILLSVFIGFSHTYYLAGLVRAPLPSPIVHIHGAIFSSWIVLLVVQCLLASVHRIGLHKRLGILGFCIACLMVIFGLWAATNALGRNSAPVGADPKTFYVVSVSDMVNFSVLIFFAFKKRSDSATHKRLIMIGTIALLTAAFARFHTPFLFQNPLHAMLASYVFLLMLVMYDLWSTHKIYRATLLGSAFMIAIQFARMPFAQTHLWQGFASWAQSLKL
jgi:hypothetical protein